MKLINDKNCQCQYSVTDTLIINFNKDNCLVKGNITMGLFDLFKKKQQTKVVKIEEKTPIQISTPKISTQPETRGVRVMDIKPTPILI